MPWAVVDEVSTDALEVKECGKFFLFDSKVAKSIVGVCPKAVRRGPFSRLVRSAEQGLTSRRVVA